MKGSTAAHSALVRSILAELGSMPSVVLGLNPAGLATYVSRSGSKHVVAYGWPASSGGSPDILAAVAPLGRLVALEAKTGDAKPTREQRECHEALRAVGVEVQVVHTVEEALAAIRAAMHPPARGCTCAEPKPANWYGLTFCSRCGLALGERAA